MHFVYVTCREDAKRLADKLKKITVADIIDGMKVSVKPFALHNNKICRIYKLKMKLYKPELYPKYADGLSKDWEETLRTVFVRQLEDEIEKHVKLLSRITGIKDFTADPESKASNELGEDISNNVPQLKEDDDDDGEHGEGTDEDLGLDAQKQMQQATDEMDYEDNSDEEVDEGNTSAGSDGENDESEIDETDNPNSKEETAERQYEAGNPSELPQKKTKSSSAGEEKSNEAIKLKPNEKDRAIFMEANGCHFEIHFKFTNEPHILLAQVKHICPLYNSIHFF